MENIKEKLTARFGAKLDEWKKQYAPRQLSVIEVEDKVAVLRPVGAAEVSTYTMQVAGEGGLETASRYLLEELWLGGDDELRNDEEYFISAMLAVQQTIELKKSNFTKL